MSSHRITKLLVVALMASATCGCDRKADRDDSQAKNQTKLSPQPPSKLHVSMEKPPAASSTPPIIPTETLDSTESMSALVKQARTGPRSKEAVVAMHKLLSSWDPVGKQMADIKAILGTPSDEKPGVIVYRIDTGDSNYEWSIAISNGVAQSIKKTVFE